MKNPSSNKTSKHLTPLKLFVALIPFLTGVFYEWESALVSVSLVILIIIDVIRKKKLSVDLGLPLYFSVGVILFHAISAFWAVDWGMVPLGVLKFLPLPLFVIAASQISDTDKRDLIGFLPWSGAIMTILSFGLSFVNSLRGHIIVSGRIGGFFEYPNVYAMFLLICLMIVVFNEQMKRIDWIFAIIHLAGIVLSGSRTVIALTAVTAVIFVIWVKEKKIKIISIAALSACAVLGGLFFIGKLSSLKNGSTFYGRLLYFRDALPVILKHPFGLGYYGYYYTQGQFQTGVYSVVHIHNDLLQTMLDIGWVPAILGVVMFVKALLKTDFQRKLILIMTGLHILFDFDMQFVAMAILLLSVLIPDSAIKEKTLKSGVALPVTAIAGVGVSFFAVFFGVASFLLFSKDYDAALNWYSSYTEPEMVVLSGQEDAASMEKIADHILSRNPNCSLANSAKARVCYSSGSVLDMIAYKEKAIEYSKYNLEEYLDYIDMMKVVIALYLQSEDYESASYCMKKVIEIPKKLDKISSETSSLGLKIDDRPNLLLPDDYADYISTLEEVML